jgi:hypothetical protein
MHTPHSHQSFYGFTNLAVATELKTGALNQGDYKIWYLKINSFGEVFHIGTMTKEELIADIFKNFQKTGQTLWRAFLRDETQSSPIEIFDFIMQGMFENTHFGNLPTLSEFQKVLDYLELNLELRSIA